MNYVIYARVSTLMEEQEKSFEAQMTELEHVVKILHPDFNLVGVYGDRGISGTKEERPEFQKMLADAKEKKFEIIVTKSISRFARNARVLLNTIKKLEEQNVKVIFLEENIDTSSAQQKFLLTVLGGMAEMEAENISEHVREGFALKRAAGKMARPSAICFGYKLENGEVKIDDEQAALVREIFDLFVTQNWSTEKIAINISNRGFVTRRGNRWFKTSILYLLQNRKYLGIAEEHDGDKTFEFENVYPQIIDEVTFLKAQEIIKNRKNGRHTKQNFQAQLYPLSGLTFCSCGEKCTRLTKGSPASKNLDLQEPCAGIAVWGCMRKMKGSYPCDGIQISEFYLYEMIIKGLIKVVQQTAFEDRGEFWEKFIEPFEQTTSDFKKEFEAYMAQKKNLEKQREKELDLYRSGLVTLKEAELKVKAIDKDLRELQQPKTPEAQIIDADALASFIKAVHSGTDSYEHLRKLFLDPTIRRELVRGFVEKIDFTEEKYKAKITFKNLDSVVAFSKRRSPYKRQDGMHFDEVEILDDFY